jgi:hypothetical protein
VLQERYEKELRSDLGNPTRADLSYIAEGVVRILLDVIVLTDLLQAYKARPRPRSGVPFAFVLSDRGFGAWYSNRFVAKVCSLS